MNDDKLPYYLAPQDVRLVANVIKDLPTGFTWEDLARAALIAHYAPRSDLFRNPLLMTKVIAALTKRLGTKVVITDDELEAMANQTISSRVDESVIPNELHLQTSSLIPVSDEPRSIN